ncbi:MAG: alkaline phosphatase family protein [Acidobacteria bacterium]|nr:alkaline phosphatase family protein [Acidobacteriota bacterium]
MRKLLLVSLMLAASLPGRPLLLISVDGLDHRYLREAGAMGLKIPHLRRLMAESAWAERGVIGVVPTVTFPSHTTIVTGVRPDQHGILSNNRPKEEGGERYFFASLLKVPALWDAAKKAGLKVGAVHWPVTVDSKSIDFDFPEYFKRRQGAGMDWESTALKATPGLIDRMVARYPSMPVEWVDDRVRALATIFLLKEHQPDLLLLHLVDHDSEAHETGPFTIHAKAMVERTDELLGDIIAAKPPDMAVALVSDHGFERVDEVLNVFALLREAGIKGEGKSSGTMFTTDDDTVARFVRSLNRAREIPAAEWRRYAPATPKPLAVFEAPPNTKFATDPAAPARVKKLSGDHGFWPQRANYRSTFMLWTPGGRPARLGEINMLSIAGRLALVLNLDFGKDTK